MTLDELLTTLTRQELQARVAADPGDHAALWALLVTTEGEQWWQPETETH